MADAITTNALLSVIALILVPLSVKILFDWLKFGRSAVSNGLHGDIVQVKSDMASVRFDTSVVLTKIDKVQDCETEQKQCLQQVVERGIITNTLLEQLVAETREQTRVMRDK